MIEKDIYSELHSIRNLMERSTKFISLSGMAGIMAGIYALIGAYIGYDLIYAENTGLIFREASVNDPMVFTPLFLVAATVLILSISTGIWLSIGQARKKGESFWNPVSKRFLSSLIIPLMTGGFFILILISRGDYSIISSSCLIFYGLALVAGSNYTFSDVKWLGLCEIILGLFSALFPGYGIIFWAIGFGALHILYGSIMHFKYKQ